MVDVKLICIAEAPRYIWIYIDKNVALCWAGDPRISSANIIWINPDTTTWVRNPSKNQKGELAIDVVIEKSVVKQSGDAWRIALDSCVPVLHLIDTRRSIPYAIKQIQELLGISCSFEQAVQVISNISLYINLLTHFSVTLEFQSLSCGKVYDLVHLLVSTSFSLVLICNDFLIQQFSIWLTYAKAFIKTK